MKYYDFFFSFSSLDWKPGEKHDLKSFFKALEGKLGDLGRHDGGFFAPDDIHRGSAWEPELADALAASKVLVPVYSPNYFTKSVYCGKEYQVFARRFEENVTAPLPDVKQPEVMLPLIWTKDMLVFPEGVTQIQYKAGTDPAAYIDKGLAYMMKSPKRFGDKYTQFVEDFGLELAKMAGNQGANKLRKVPAWNDLAPPFPPEYRPGLARVRYVFLSGLQQQMSKHRTQFQCYGIYDDRQDWRPCFPIIENKAGEIAKSAAIDSNKDCEFLEHDCQLIDKLKEARALNNTVIVLADPWTLMKVNDFKSLADQFDKEEFPNSGVIVTWNENDPETKAALAELEKTMETVFQRRKVRGEFLKARVTSPDEIRQALITAFNAIRERLSERREIRSAGSDPNAAPQPVLKV